MLDRSTFNPSRYFSTDFIPVESAFVITLKINSFASLFSFDADINDKIDAYVTSTSSLNPPVSLNASIISEVI